MQLTRLEIKGFKSFGDKIIINFNEGITAIVGPNGCGKSNVVDAIRWVLGEQSTRMLRSEKMENVIFNGSKSRKPANLAEVSLSFDNTKNILPIEFSQVTVTRKLYRTGESEYRLNNVQCRLKDITDLFLDTGIGADSYSIIELKMIEEIISNKEGSRRNLFEEASGISKYKLRKKQTFNKLKDTEADLMRVDDLLFEIEKNLKTLENQAKKAERYNRLKDQYKSLSVSLASFRVANFSSALAKIEAREVLQKTEKAGIITRMCILEAGLQKQKLDSLTAEKNLSVQQKATNDFIGKIRAYESEKKVRNEQLKFQKDKEQRLAEELDRDRNQLNHVLYNIKRLNQEKETEQEKLVTVTGIVYDLKKEVEDLRTNQVSAREKINQLSTINNEFQNRIYKTEKDTDILKIQLQALEQESQRNMEDAAGKETELSEFDKAIAELLVQTETLQTEYKTLADNEADLKIKVNDANDDLAKINQNVRDESRKLDAKQNEYTLTKSMVDNLEGFPESIRFLKKSAGWSKSPVLFSDILFCKEEYRVAIENYLEPLMNHYVVDTFAEAAAAINLLSNAARGRAQFFVLNTYKVPLMPPEADTAGNVAAIDVTQVDDKYQALCRTLLNGVFLTDLNLEEAFARPQPEGVTIIAKAGKFNISAHTAAGGSVGLFEGKRIGRTKNLEILAREIKGVEAALHKANTTVAELQNKLSAYHASSRPNELLQKQKQLNLLNTELVTVKTRREQYQNFIENSRNRKEDIAGKMAAIRYNITAAEPIIAALRSEKQIQQDLLTQNQQAFNELNELYHSRSAIYNQENIRFHQQQNTVAGLDKDLQYRQVQHDTINKHIKENSVALENVQQEIQTTLQHTDHSDDDLLEMYRLREEMEKGITEAETLYYRSKGSITETEHDIALQRRQKEQADLIENELKDERNNLRIDLNALKERLSAEFNVDIQNLLDIAPPEGETEHDLRDKTDKIKRQLDEFGAVNPMAIEAYNEMEDRFKFINAQKKDLLDAKDSLLETIKEIDDTAREKFMEAFINVRENFIKVFRSLFNEQDSCDLILSEPNNPLESDIDIIAKPKGKRPLSINQLSGGEKTLTATAILFSLYLLKPAPFCIFDEVDAPLDDTNIDKFNNIIRKFSSDSQFIVVSHNKRTIASTDIIYGVTMVEQGVSRVVAVDLREFAN